jgi:hypothetical protein
VDSRAGAGDAGAAAAGVPGCHPIIDFVRADATPDQVKDIYGRVGALIREAGLEA